MKIGGVNPDLVLLCSWNDFRHGTEIAPSREFGYQYIDSTKLATLQLANRRGFCVRLLSDTLPKQLYPGQYYPVDLTVKNGTIAKMVTHDGFRVDYRILQHRGQVASGNATQVIVLYQVATARLHFNLYTGSGPDHPLPAGNYELCLDFRRNRVPFMELPFMTETLGSLTIPFTVGPDNGSVQVLNSEIPAAVPSGAVLPYSLQLRNLDADSWHQGKTRFNMRWATTDGTALSSEVSIPLKKSVASGDIATLQGDLPPAPQQAGWYDLQLLFQGDSGAEREVQSFAARVAESDLRAQFLSIDFPNTAESKTVEVPIALRNPGQSPWPATETQVVYQWLRLGWPTHSGRDRLDGAARRGESEWCDYPAYDDHAAAGLRHLPLRPDGDVR